MTWTLRWNWSTRSQPRSSSEAILLMKHHLKPKKHSNTYIFARLITQTLFSQIPVYMLMLINTTISISEAKVQRSSSRSLWCPSLDQSQKFQRKNEFPHSSMSRSCVTASGQQFEGIDEDCIARLLAKFALNAWDFGDDDGESGMFADQIFSPATLTHWFSADLWDRASPILIYY